ncbi:MAG: hypothetical protein ACLQNE_12585 [Thermoguttaceae bacterium]
MTRDRFCAKLAFKGGDQWETRATSSAGARRRLTRAKGRSGLLWWLLSLIIGPIATFLVVVLPKVERPWER